MSGAARPTVLHVMEALEGGTARHLADVVRHAGGVEHHVAVPGERVGWVTDRAAFDAFAAAGAEVHRVGMRRSPLSLHNLRSLVVVQQLVRRLRPAVVHGHSSVGGALARLTLGPRGSARVYTPNGIATGRAALAIERVLAPRTDRLVAVSPSEASLAVARGLADERRVVTIPNGIDLDAPPPAFDLRERLGLAPGTRLVGTVARLVDQKAPLDFVAAAAALAATHDDVHVLLVGSGPQREAVDAAVAAAGIGARFHIVPVLEAVGTVLGQLDVFVLASRFEGGPYTPLEAMRGRTPVVLTDVVGNRDVIVDGVSGVLVAPGRPAALAAAIGGLLDDPARAAALVDAAADRLAARFDVRAMGRSLSELYLELSGRAGDRS